MTFLQRVSSGEVLISDGAMGTFLQAEGLRTGECPEAWNITHPEIIKKIARAYKDAGSDIVQSNSFGGNSFKFREFALTEKDVTEYNRAAARLAKESVGDSVVVAASVGPTGQIVEDEGGNASETELYNAFKIQTTALEDGGADAICIETMSSVIEAVQAIKAAKENTKLPVICTFTFELGARGFRTMMGVDPVNAALDAIDAGADVIGANCGNGIENMIDIVRQMREAVDNTPILVQANAGVPVLVDEKTVFKDTPQQMADRVQELIAAGANIIGGCCGTTPAHIEAIAKAARIGGCGCGCCCSN